MGIMVTRKVSTGEACNGGIKHEFQGINVSSNNTINVFKQLEIYFYRR